MKIRSYLQSGNIFAITLFCTIILYYYKTAFWPFTYLLIPCYLLTIITFIPLFNRKTGIGEFVADFSLPILLAAVFGISLLFTTDFTNRLPLKEAMLIGVLFSFFFFIYWNEHYLHQKIRMKFKAWFLIGCIIFVSIINLVVVLSPHTDSEFLSILHIPAGWSVSNDNNFLALLILFRLVILNYNSSFSRDVLDFSVTTKFLINSLLILNIFISGSRRGIAALVILAIVHIIRSLKTSPTYAHAERPATLKIKPGVFLLITSGILIALVFFRLPEQTLKNISYRYFSIVGITDVNFINRLLWEDTPVLEGGSGILIDKNLFNLKSGYWKSSEDETTKLSDIQTPYGNGILINELGLKPSFSLFYSGPGIIFYSYHRYMISFKIKFINGDFSSFRTGWWVDDGSRGYSGPGNLPKQTEPLVDGWFECKSFYTFIDNHAGISGFINSVDGGSQFIIADFCLKDLDYDMNLPAFTSETKGIRDMTKFMNKLNPPFDDNDNLINNGKFEHDLLFWNFNSDSVSLRIDSLEGEKALLVRKGNGEEGNWSLFYTGRNIEFIKDNEYLLTFMVKPVLPETIPFYTGFWIDEGEGYLNNMKMKSEILENGWLEVRTQFKFKNNHKNLVYPINSQLRNSQFYIKDIKLKNLTQQQNQIDSALGDAYGYSKTAAYEDRLLRWKYAGEIWKTKFNWYNKLFGHGFDFQKWYGNKFNKNIPDWPHNPFVSILLYSGVVGLSLYIWLLTRVFQLYIRYRKEQSIAFICFILTFFFSFFSGGSPFDPPVMGFFTLFPFLIHSINKRRTINEDIDHRQ